MRKHQARKKRESVDETQNARCSSRGRPSKTQKNARERESIIRPLLTKTGRTRSDVARRARQFGLHPNTLYAWLRAYDCHPSLSILSRKTRTDLHKTKLLPQVEKLIRKNLARIMELGVSVKVVAGDVASTCVKNGLPAPHYNTVRSRLCAWLEEQRLSSGGTSSERDHGHEKNRFPATHPLALVEVWLLRVDVVIIDGKERPTGEAWLTVAFDCFSGAVIGISTSERRPGQFEIGKCLASVILPKTLVLQKYGISGEWLCNGIPEVIVIHGKEFRSRDFMNTCHNYGILPVWTDEKLSFEPNVCEYVEEIKKVFTPDRVSVVRGERFEHGVISQTVAYNARVDPKSNPSPIGRFELHVTRMKTSRSRLSYSSIADANAKKRAQFDFWPSVVRTIQKNGVTIDGIRYCAPALLSWRDEANARTKGTSLKMVFKLDEQNISEVWVLHPQLMRYVKVQSRSSDLCVTWNQYRDFRRRFGRQWEERVVEERWMEERAESLFSFHNMFQNFPTPAEVNEAIESGNVYMIQG